MILEAMLDATLKFTAETITLTCDRCGHVHELLEAKVPPPVAIMESMRFLRLHRVDDCT